MLGRYEESSGKVRVAFNKPSTMDISTNNLGHVFAHLAVLFRDAEGYLLPEPKSDGDRAGMTTYLNNGHAVSVITGNDKPLWSPVSRERYLRAAIVAASKKVGLNPAPVKKGKKKPEVSTVSGNPVLVEEVRTWIDPADEKEWVEKSRLLADNLNEPVEVVKVRLQKLQAELELMTPAQRKQQARVDTSALVDGESPLLLPPDSSSGVAVVTPDFRCFSPKLPVEVIQLVVVQWKFDGNLFDPENSGIAATLNNRKLLEIYRTMDWQKLRKMVTRTVP
jgi:hypothetical protein